VSEEYKTISKALVDLLESYRQTALSANLSAEVTAVRKGMYVPGAGDDKPIVFARPCRFAFRSALAGHLSRLERMKFLISGACMAESQQAALEDAECILNNIANILEQNACNRYWGAGRLGWQFSTDEGNPEEYAQIELEPGQKTTRAHFKLLWSCEIRIGTDPV
jgi:hypothetical protein